MKHPAIAMAAAAAPLAIAAVLTGPAVTASISTATAVHQPVEATAGYFIGAIRHTAATDLDCFAAASVTIQKGVC
jgi:hypothetical protein